MSTAVQAHQLAGLAARGAPLAKAGVAAGLGKAVLVAVPAAMLGAALGYGLLKVFDVRWDAFNRRAAEGESTMGRT